MSNPPPDRGAYGFRLRGVDGARALLVPAPDEWPVLELAWRMDRSPPPDDEFIGDTYARLGLAAGGSVHIDRARGHAEYLMPVRPRDAEFVHPHLVPAAAIAARWLGRESFHGGGVVLGDGAWAMVGDKEAGKSSTLASLARAGHAVLADDLLVVDGRDALAGPRSIDLRESAAQVLGVGEPLGRVGLRDRWRVTLEPIAPAFELRGWVTLAWHDGPPEIVAVRGAERLRAIAPHRAVRLAPTDPHVVIALSALPCYELRRPRDWASLRDATDLLVASLT